MKQISKIIIPIILLISFQSILGQNIKKQTWETNIFNLMADAEFDLVIRINRDMNDEELKSRIGVLHSFDKDIKIEYSRDESENIKTLSGSGSGGSCMSDDFGFIIIALKDKHWKACMISDKK